MVAGCSAGYSVDEQEAQGDLGTATEELAACQGDDVNYDYNAFAASLAVAVANELGRWDVTADFEVRNGKLELSATGQLRCGSGCNNVKALLRLQDDSAASVPNHSPSIFRSKLTSWHGQQAQKLTALVNGMLNLNKGIYRIKAGHSGQYMAVADGSTSDGAAVEQKPSTGYAGADQWRVVLDNGKHKFINVRSGKCLSLATDSIADGPVVQRTCSTSAAQKFEFAALGGNWAIRTAYGKALDVEYASTARDARVIQYTWDGGSANQSWGFEPYGSAGHVAPNAIATAVYTLTARHSGKTLGVDNGSLNDGTPIEQHTYNASDDRFHWYVIRNGSKYNLVNRRSGKCMGLASDNADALIVQQTCNAAITGQAFTLQSTGDGHQAIYSKFQRLLDVKGANTGDGVLVGQYDGGWNYNRMFAFKPIIAGEPHRLTYAYKTSDAACGEYNYWYKILKPNGQSLDFPQDTFVQLMFAGGKQTETGADINPFIAQQMSGDLVAIDPTSSLNETGTTSSGSCTAACTKYSMVDVTGQCCSCNGANKKYLRSAFSPTMYTCTGL